MRCWAGTDDAGEGTEGLAEVRVQCAPIPSESLGVHDESNNCPSAGLDVFVAQAPSMDSLSAEAAIKAEGDNDDVVSARSSLVMATAGDDYSGTDLLGDSLNNGAPDLLGSLDHDEFSQLENDFFGVETVQCTSSFRFDESYGGGHPTLC